MPPRKAGREAKGNRTPSPAPADSTERAAPAADDDDSDDSEIARLSAPVPFDKAFDTTEFQTHLAADQFTEALAVLKRVGVLGIDFTRAYAPAPPFVSCLYHWCSDYMTPAQRHELFDAFASAGIVNRQTLTDTFGGADGRNVLIEAVQYIDGAAFEFLLAHAPAGTVDWTVQCPNGVSPLLLALLADQTEGPLGAPATPLTEAQRDVFDRRAVRLIAMLPDHALNAVDVTGHTPITWAIKGARVLALDALIGRLPAVELQPELRLTPWPGGAAVVSVTQALAASNAPTASYQPLRARVAALVQAARVAMQHYTTAYQPLVKLVLQHTARLSPVLSIIVWSYLA